MDKGMFLAVALMLGSILLLWIAAFRVSAMWGLCVLFFPPSALLFIPLHWNETRLALVPGAAALALIFLIAALN